MFLLLKLRLQLLVLVFCCTAPVVTSSAGYTFFNQSLSVVIVVFSTVQILLHFSSFIRFSRGEKAITAAFFDKNFMWFFHHSASATSIVFLVFDNFVSVINFISCLNFWIQFYFTKTLEADFPQKHFNFCINSKHLSAFASCFILCNWKVLSLIGE